MVNLNLTANAEITKFRSEKSWQTALAILIPATLVLISAVMTLLEMENRWGSYFITFIFLIINSQICWMWFDTGYEISDAYLHYHSGPMRGKIEIAKIRKIERKKELFAGMKPALGVHGIIVHYDKYEDIYFSPENQEAFVQELRRRNNKIELG